VQLHHVGARVLDHGEHEGAAEAEAARRLAHVDAPEQPLVPLLGKRPYREAGHADEIRAIKSAEYRLPFEASGDLGQALADLLVRARREGTGMPHEPLQSQRPECRRVLRAKPSHRQIHRILPTN
jgi:hypothetical protein